MRIGTLKKNYDLKQTFYGSLVLSQSTASQIFFGILKQMTNI